MSKLQTFCTEINIWLCVYTHIHLRMSLKINRDAIWARERCHQVYCNNIKKASVTHVASGTVLLSCLQNPGWLDELNDTGAKRSVLSRARVTDHSIITATDGRGTAWIWFMRSLNWWENQKKNYAKQNKTMFLQFCIYYVK